MHSNKISLAVSTYKDSIFGIENIFSKIYDQCELIVVVHQLDGECDKLEYSTYKASLEKAYSKIKIITDIGKGLSRSRNIALEFIKGRAVDYIFLSDDDNVFIADGVKKTIEYNNINSIDVSISKILTDTGKDFKNYNGRSVVTKRKLASVSSLEICLSVPFVRRMKLKFDEDFGLGAKYPSCEEFIFLVDALKCGANIRYVDEYINIHTEESSGQNLNNIEIAIAKGAAFKRVYGSLAILVIFIFAVKKAFDKKHDDSFSFFKFISRLYAGFSEYSRE
ncbi:glycosyltransferase family A protein [Aeromonas media]|uniref:glycosyltransferase family A protein n=1 Tax=Aeromonas media TaxID=651 RepID=UPI0022814F4E|nr:glycosyltransferase family A protein [Aeromonas media]MCY9821475.1 glycosyltransferase family A protein [Aeromonas media]